MILEGTLHILNVYDNLAAKSLTLYPRRWSSPKCDLMADVFIDNVGNYRSMIGVGESQNQHHMKNYTMIHHDTSNPDSSRTAMSQKNKQTEVSRRTGRGIAELVNHTDNCHPLFTPLGILSHNSLPRENLQMATYITILIQS